ncbi:MAG: hypothetical protein K9J30_01035 [Bacteroidales bacterium]|nr:hypothetical protein [Bacteroidales bacterium]
MEKITVQNIFKNRSLPLLALVFIGLFYASTNFVHHNWTKTNPANSGVIKYDIKHYYAYLTAGIIHGDLKMEFLSDPDFQYGNRYYRTRHEGGNFLIITSMGLAFLYLPFFLMAHFLAIIFGLPHDGYGSIYQFFIVFGGWTYALLGLFILKNLLLDFFSNLTTVITLILIALGTNLYYYSTFEAAMPHVYNFFLLILFVRQVIRWFDKPGWGNAMLIGSLLGLISLIRPTNILIFFVLFFWNIKTFRELKERINFFIGKFQLVLLMLASFAIVWLPQVLYWKMVTGNFFYFSYGAAGASFYFSSPQVLGSLFSFIKGWYIYTPVMFVATLGIICLYKNYRKIFLPVLLLYISMVYVLSSWWSWWFGGGFGLRAYIDIYGIMALPLAAITEEALKWNKVWIKRIFFAVLLFFLYLSWHQTYQYYKGMIHYCGMTKESYRINFLKFKRGDRYWQSLGLPDHLLARQGIYYYYDTGEDTNRFIEISWQEAFSDIREEVTSDKKLMRSIHRHARREGISDQEALEMVIQTIYEKKSAGKNLK